MDSLFQGGNIEEKERKKNKITSVVPEVNLPKQIYPQRMGFFPVLLQKREWVKEQAICFRQDYELWVLRTSLLCLWEQSNLQAGLLWIWSASLRVQMGHTTLKHIRIFISRGHRKEKLFEYWIRTYCISSFIDQLASWHCPSTPSFGIIPEDFQVATRL